MRLFGHELVPSDRLEHMQEAQEDLRMIRRELEDIGYEILNNRAGHLDVKPVQRERMYRRILRYYIEEPLVGASVDMLPTFVFGRGLPKPESSNDRVQAALDDFWNDEDNKLALTTFQAQYQKAIELQLQANIFFVVFEEPNWGIRVGTIPHEEVVEIISHPENRQKHLWYKREFMEEYYDFDQGYYEPRQMNKRTVWYQHWQHEVPTINGQRYQPTQRPDQNIYVETTGKILHMRQGGTSEMKFGTPSVQRVIDWAKAHNEWMRSRVAIAKAAAAFAWERKVKTGSDPNKVMSIARSWATQKRQPTSLSGLPGDPGEYDPAYAPRYAAMLNTNEGVDYTFRGANMTGSADASSDQKMFRSMISAGTRIPQHWLGDEGSANLATATAMNEPPIRMMEFTQEQWESLFRMLLDKHLDVRGLGPEQVSTKAEIQISEAINEFLEANGQDGDSTPGDLGMNDRSALRPNVQIKGGVILDPTDSPEEAANRPVYKLAFPPILTRDVAAQVNMVVDAVTGLDPAGDNTDLTRWAFREILKIMGEVEPDRIVDEIFPTHNLADQFAQNVDKGQEQPPGADPSAGPGPADPALAPVGDTGVNPPLDQPLRQSPGAPGAPGNQGLGQGLTGDQQGARMGASLTEAGIRLDDMAEFEKINEMVMQRLINPTNSPRVQRLIEAIESDQLLPA